MPKMPTLRSLVVVVVFDMFDAWGPKYCFFDESQNGIYCIHWFDALKFNHSHKGSR